MNILIDTEKHLTKLNIYDFLKTLNKMNIEGDENIDAFYLTHFLKTYTAPCRKKSCLAVKVESS